MQAVAFLLLAAVGSPWAIPESNATEKPTAAQAAVAPQRPATRVKLDDSAILQRHRAALERATRQQAVAPAAPVRRNPYRDSRSASGQSGVRLAGFDQPESDVNKVELAQHVPTAWPTTGKSRETEAAGNLGAGDPYSRGASNAGEPEFQLPEFDMPEFGEDSNSGLVADPRDAAARRNAAANRSAANRATLDHSAGGRAATYRNQEPFAGARPLQNNVRPAQQPAARRQRTPAAVNVPEFDARGTIGTRTNRRVPALVSQVPAQTAPVLSVPNNDPYKRIESAVQTPVVDRSIPAATEVRAQYSDRVTPQDRGLGINVSNPIPGVTAGAKNAIEKTGNVVGNAADEISRTSRGGNGLLTLAFFASVGLNFYLGWIAWDTYNRYQDMVSDMRYSGNGGARRDRLDRDADRRGDRRLGETGAY